MRAMRGRARVSGVAGDIHTPSGSPLRRGDLRATNRATRVRRGRHVARARHHPLRIVFTLGRLHFYRVHDRRILTGSLTESANAGSTDSPLGHAEQPYDRAPRGQPFGCRS